MSHAPHELQTNSSRLSSCSDDLISGKDLPLGSLTTIPSPLVTIVSAYFDIDSKHSHVEYMGWIKHAFMLLEPFVIYAPPDTIPGLVKLRQNKPAEFIGVNLMKSYSASLLSTTQWEKQLNSDPEKSIHKTYRLYWIWLEKSQWLLDTSVRNPFRTSFFAWIDIGYFRNARYENTKLFQQIPRGLNHTNVLLLNVSSLVQKAYVGGGFIGGYPEGILRWHSSFYKQLTSNLDQFIGKDQPWMMSTCKKNDNLCLLVEPYDCCGDQWFFMSPYVHGETRYSRHGIIGDEEHDCAGHTKL